MAVDAEARRHFALIRDAKADERAAQRREALQATVAERIAVGFLLGAVPRDAATEARLDVRAAAQIELARRGRARS